MNLGFDLDKIFINYPPIIPVIIIDWLYKRKLNEGLSYRIPGKSEQIIRIISHYHLFRSPIQKNLMFIKNLRESSNHRHFLISSRFSFLKKKTEELVIKHKLHKLFDELYFNFENKQPHLFKNNIIKKLKLQKYVDDDLSLLKYVSMNNPRTFFYWLNDKTKGKLTKNLTAITDLSEMLK